MRINGLYGHVRSNDARSLALFAGFIAAFHLLAMLALMVPLAMLDPEHAPLYGWTGYLFRWVPIVTAVGGILFAVQMAWHVRTVRRRTDFHFVDDHDEPRLCRIVEPLAIAAGLPTPYVGVIDSPALNAFACGIRRKDAVLVFTRGLIEGLDDDELAAVAAHEIMHIVNGDIRLIAATNVCLDTLRLLQQRRSGRPANRIREALSLPILALLLPLMAVLILVMMFLRRLAVDGSHLARLLIASAREFIADAEAVRLTQNPSALVSALRRIEGKSVIPGLAAGQDAMMIDGAHEGAYATHPTIAERIAAIVSVTGSMAVIAPAHRDTRQPELRAKEGFGRRLPPTLEMAFSRREREGTLAALTRVSSGDEFNRFGLTREMAVGAVAAVGVFLWVHSADLTRPSELAKAFDPGPLRAFFAMGGEGMRCQMQGIGSLIGMAEKPTGCEIASVDEMLAPHRDEKNILGMLVNQRAGVREGNSGLHEWPDGTFRSAPPPDVELAEVKQSRCFQTDRYSVGDRGLHSVTEEPDDTISLPRYFGLLDAAAARVTDAAPTARDAAILDYFEARKTLGMVIHRFFGDPGLQLVLARYEEPAHLASVALLRQRIADPAFAAGMSPLERAEIELLAESPTGFISCTARRERAAQR